MEVLLPHSFSRPDYRVTDRIGTQPDTSFVCGPHFYPDSDCKYQHERLTVNADVKGTELPN